MTLRNFLATDIDEKSLAHAQHNVALNEWQQRIELRRVTDPKKILVGVLRDDETYATHAYERIVATYLLILMVVLRSFDFCMCNPPFFADIEETAQVPTVRPAPHNGFSF